MLVTILISLNLLSSPVLAGSAPARQEGKPLEVVTTLGVLADLARTLGGPYVHAEALADPRQDPHYVEPKPTLMEKARAADLFVEVGLGLELWGDKVVAGSGNPRIQAGQPGRVIASQGVQTLELPAVLSREWGDVHPQGNPHVWLDPLNARIMAENIERALAAADPAHAEAFHTNLEAFQRRIDEALFGAELVDDVGARQLARQARAGRLNEYLEREGLSDKLGGWLARAAPLRGRPIITYHKTCIYLAERFGFTIPIEIEEKPGIPPSARQRDHVVERIRTLGVKTLLQEVFYERAAAAYLAEQTGAHVLVVPIDVGPEVGVADYFALIERLLDELVRSETSGS